MNNILCVNITCYLNTENNYITIVKTVYVITCNVNT